MVFLLALFSVTGALVLSMAGLTQSASSLLAANRAVAKQQAFHLAEAGLDDGLRELTVGGSDFDGWDDGAGGPCVTACEKAATLPTGTYEVRIADITVTTLEIVSAGSVSTALGAPSQADAHVEAFVELDGTAPFQQAVCGDTEVRVEHPGTLVDSYDSGTGPYDIVTNRTWNGHVRTNSTADDTVRIENVSIYGDLIVGQGATPPEDVVDDRGGNLVTGTVYAAPANLPLDPIEIPPGLPHSGDLTSSQVLPAGLLRYGVCSASSGVVITTGGDVTLYCDTLTVDGGDLRGRAAGADHPPSLIVNVLGTSEVEVRGGSTFVGAIYAPNTPRVRIRGGAVVFGAAVSGQELRVEEGAQVHFDEALKSSTLGTAETSLQSWRSWGQN